MNNTNKGISILMYLIWPFSAVFIGVKNFDFSFGRNLLIASFIFLGFTSSESGDLKRYAARYYEISDYNFIDIVDLFLHFQLNRFFTDITAVLFSFFENHQIYFAFLFGLFGYLLVNTINILRITLLKKTNFLTIVIFITFALFYSILAIHNYAFYAGGIYFLYFLLRYIFEGKQRKYLIYLTLTPLFHLGLTILLLLPILFLIFKQNTKWYLLLLIASIFVSQSSVTDFIEKTLVSEGTVFENRFNAYASETGFDRMELRYSESYQSGNRNYKLLVNTRELALKYALPLLLLALFLNIRTIKDEKTLTNLMNLSTGAMAITQIMLNISQGERYYLITGFLVLSTLVYYIQVYNIHLFKYKIILYLTIPTLLIYNFVSLIVSKSLISEDFIFSNFPLLFYEMLK